MTIRKLNERTFLAEVISQMTSDGMDLFCVLGFTATNHHRVSGLRVASTVRLEQKEIIIDALEKTIRAYREERTENAVP